MMIVKYPGWDDPVMTTTPLREHFGGGALSDDDVRWVRKHLELCDYERRLNTHLINSMDDLVLRL